MNKNGFPCVVSIAGTDPSGGAGIQADIKAISATGAYAASVITALVAQNTQGVKAILQVPADFVSQQIDVVFSDLDVHAVKIGMLHDERIIEVVAAQLQKLKPQNVVFDPVMIAKDDSELLDLNTIEFLKSRLLPSVSLLTPNLFEAERLLGATITSTSEMALAARQLGTLFNLDVLVKGGHLNGQESSDVFYNLEQNDCHWFDSKRIVTKNTHGTGCSLSSAIASYLAQGFQMYDAINKAKQYLTYAIESGAKHSVGRGCGPVDHFYFLENRLSD